MLEQLLERWNDVLPRLLMATAGGEPRFETVIGETVRFFYDDPDRARLLVREILDRPADMQKRLESTCVRGSTWSPITSAAGRNTARCTRRWIPKRTCCR